MIVKFRSNGRKFINGSISKTIDCDIHVNEDLSFACVCISDEDVSYFFDISKEFKSIINKEFLEWDISKKQTIKDFLNEKFSKTRKGEN